MPPSYIFTEQPRKGGIDQKGVRRYTRTFEVRVTAAEGADPMASSPGVISSAVLTHLGIDLFSSYSDGLGSDTNALLKKVMVDQGSEWIDWTVTLEYDSEPNAVDRGSSGAHTNAQPGKNAQNVAPNKRHPTISWGYTKRKKVLAIDYADTPILNSAGCPFDPPYETDVNNTVLMIKFQRLVAAYDKISFFMNTINAFIWGPFGYEGNVPVFEPGTLRVNDYKIVSSFENGLWYWDYEIAIEIKPDGWRPYKILDAGTMYKPVTDSLKDGETPLRPITRDGRPVTKPVPLDGAGQPLRLADFNSTGFVYLEFEVFEETNFSQLIPPI